MKKKYTFPYKGAIIILASLLIISIIINNINKPTKEEVKASVISYIEQKDNNTTTKERWFADLEIYGISKKFNKIYAYTWIVEESYYLEDNVIYLKETKMNPHRLTIKYTDKKIEIIKDEIPSDSNYRHDLNKLFPLRYRKKITSNYLNLSTKASEYFKSLETE